MRLLRERVEAAKIKLSVVTKVEIVLPDSGVNARTGANDLKPSGTGELVEESLVEGSVLILTRADMEAACEGLLQRLKAPLYEVALAAKIALPGEEQVAAPNRKPKKKARQAAEALLPKGKRTYLPQGELLSEIIMVGGAAQMAAVSMRRMIIHNCGVPQ